MSEHQDSSASEKEVEFPEGTTFPLSSRRVTLPALRAIGQALDLGFRGRATKDEILIALEGKLRETREFQNLQVIVQERESGVNKLFLVDEDGVFLETEYGKEPARAEADHEQTIVRLQQEVEELTAALQESERQLGEYQLETEHLRAEVERSTGGEDTDEIEALRAQLKKEKDRAKKLWALNCRRATEQENLLLSKDLEIQELESRLEGRSRSTEHESSSGESELSPGAAATLLPIIPPSRPHRKGKAPPIDQYTGENPEVRFDDWLPTLTRTASWNGWSESEKLIQLAGHLRGRALQEWDLLEEADKCSWKKALPALRGRLDQGTKVLAAQDFRHTTQNEGEKVADFVRRLERAFHIAYGREAIAKETREAFLYGQLQEGLRMDVLRNPAVSGALTYRELIMAAKNEEQRQCELKKRRNYQSVSGGQPGGGGYKERPSDRNKSRNGGFRERPSDRSKNGKPTPSSGAGAPVCHKCGKTGHFAHSCWAKKTESRGSNHKPAAAKNPHARQVTSKSQSAEDDLLGYLFSSDDDSVKMVRVKDEGSHSQMAGVLVQGFPVEGIIDSGADITIVNGDLFKKIAASARLKKKNFKPADKCPRTYNRQVFTLDGRMDLDITFGDRTMVTPVYIKMDAQDPLLLSEGVCRQLGILTYHPDVLHRGRNAVKPTVASSESSDAVVPMVRVRLLQAVKLPPQHCGQFEARLEAMLEGEGALLLESSPELEGSGVWAQESLIEPRSGTVQVVLSNPTGFTQSLEKNDVVGIAEVVAVTLMGEEVNEDVPAVQRLSTTNRDPGWRKERVRDLFRDRVDLPSGQKEGFIEFLTNHHRVFSLEDGERGETSLVECEVDTGDATPTKQRPYRTPFAVRAEVTQMLKKMEAAGVIEPSHSPWASPIVLVRKRDGSHRFCVDYRALNSVTKPDTFPLPTISDLLDQLGGSKFFSTLDLASGYWQVKMHPESKQKTAFVTHEGLHEFCVMPFGLKNAPSVFQRLMQQALAGLKDEDGSEFVSVYFDDILVHSRTWQDHLRHLALVITRLLDEGLLLQPLKCQFIRKEIHFLGHVLTSQGLKTSEHHVRAVREFKVPADVREVRQFLGLASYYRRFIQSFAKIAHPLHGLTKKGALFDWNVECQEAFDTLKKKLTESPVLSYPRFDRGFTLETDASGLGLGAVVSQTQEDGKLHPIAFASRALSPCEKNYGITELETLAVVWAISHFKPYLYGRDVMVFTDHSAVCTILQNPHASGKHARWWLKVHGSGLKSVQLKHRSGRENANADALSRSPRAAEEQEEQDSFVVVASLCGEDAMGVSQLLHQPPEADFSVQPAAEELAHEQEKDPDVRALLDYLKDGSLPSDEKHAQKLVRQASLFTVANGILYYLDPKCNHRRRAVVPRSLREKIMQSVHGGSFAGHFSGNRLYQVLVRSWYWEGMYTDCEKHRKGCPQCCYAMGGGRVTKPPLQPIPVSRPFQILGIDVMDLPQTERGNKHVLVIQDFLTKWPWVFPIPDQKTTRIVEILVQEIIPMCGVPEALLSDRGTNLLSFLMKDVCECLGIEKLNTTAYHPQCDGLTERFNRTLKTMLRKHAGHYGLQWDQYLHGVVWAYRNTPHESTSEKPSYLLFGRDCRFPVEAALLPAEEVEEMEVSDYRKELTQLLAKSREQAMQSIQSAQKKYQRQYDKINKSVEMKYSVGDWVIIRFPQEESGRLRKLSRPWHGPYRVTETTATGITGVRVYGCDQKPIHVHLNRVTRCPPNFPAGYFWYGNRRNGPGRPPTWIDDIVRDRRPDSTQQMTMDTDPDEEPLDGIQEPEQPEASVLPQPVRTRTRTINPPDYLRQLTVC